MKEPLHYFVFNKKSDYQRGWSRNIVISDGSIRVQDCTRPGIFWSRLLDSREKESTWHRLTMESRCLGDASIRFTLYCSESRNALWQGELRDVGELLGDDSLSDDDRQTLCPIGLQALNPRDVLLHELVGRYVWFRIELLPQGGESPEVGNCKLYLPKETWLDYLPEVYQEDPAGKSFTERFLGIFQSLYSDLDANIRTVARYFDPDVVGGEYLDWLAGWLDVEDGYLWPQEKLRLLVKHGMELYRIRGTRQYVIEMIKLYTGQTPYVVEYSQIEPFLEDVGQTTLLHELYGDTPYMITVVLDALRTNEEYKALLRILEGAKPAWIEANLVVLKPYIFLNRYSYLGMNSTLSRYGALHLDGYSALPFTSLGASSADS
ncbi:MAG: phage tail protein [Oscillospiraceae bacterium]